MAEDDSYSLKHDTTLNEPASGVLGNDYFSGGSGGSGGSLSAVLVSGPTQSVSFQLNSDGSFSYQPTSNWAGTDTFTYYATASGQTSNTATVTLNVTNATPTSQADSYQVDFDTFDTAALALAGVLDNDYDADADSLTAALVSGPSHGAVTLNSDGSFVYTPTLGYVGADSFTYEASDGIAGSVTTVTLDVVKPFGTRSNQDDRPSAPAQVQWTFATSGQTGGVDVSHDVAPGHALVFQSLTDSPEPIIAVEASFGSGPATPVPTQVEAYLTLNGTTGSSVFYSTSSGLYTGDVVRFALQSDASLLATGRYAYTLTLISTYSSGNTSTQYYEGHTEIVNRSATEFGAGWALADLDRLHAGTGGVLFVSGAGMAGWFSDAGGGTFTSPSGPLSSSTLVQNANGTYTLTDKFGARSEFSSAGLLTSRVDPNGNTTTYSYADADGNGQATEISQITDPFNRTITFTYSGGLLSSVTDFASRVTSLGRNASGQITSITAPDPDGAGSEPAPVTTYSYTSGVGSQKRYCPIRTAPARWPPPNCSSVTTSPAA